MYTERFAERKLGLDKGQGCWPCITWYYPLISVYNQKYKKLSWTIKDGPISRTGFLEIWLPPCRLSLFLSPSLSFSGWFLGTWRLSVSTYLPGVLRPTREGAQGGAPSSGRLWPNIDGASFLSWNLISFPCKPRHISLFSPLIFLLQYSFLISLYISK